MGRRAISDSKHPTTTATASISSTATPVASAGSVSGLKGLSRAAIRPAYSVILSAAAYCMAARSGPLWSSTITSWIMVSSRWVSGSSTGTRAASSCSRIIKATTRGRTIHR
ncbi:hypothetical protein D9M69_725800 [compost metagenome]